jgi:hypothetical protein
VTDHSSALHASIVDFVRQRDNVSFAELANHIEGVRGGDVALHIPGFENIIVWVNLTQEAADVLTGLVADKLIHFAPTSPLVYLADGAIPGMPLARQAKRYKAPHWVPLVLKPGPGQRKRHRGQHG